MNYISQNLSSFKYGKEAKNISRRYHDLFCTIILSAICKKFEAGEEPYTAEDLSRQYNIPIRLTKNILFELQDLQLIYEGIKEKGSDQDTCYLPGIDTNKMSLGLMLSKLDSKGFENFNINKELHPLAWDAIIITKEQYLNRSNEILLKDL